MLNCHRAPAFGHYPCGVAKVECQRRNHFDLGQCSAIHLDDQHRKSGLIGQHRLTHTHYQLFGFRLMVQRPQLVSDAGGGDHHLLATPRGMLFQPLPALVTVDAPQGNVRLPVIRIPHQ
jgi:hypothetical protein